MAEDKNKPAKAEAAKADKLKKEQEKFTVASEFRDKNNFDKIYKVGEDVNSFDPTRLEDLISRGLVKKA